MQKLLIGHGYLGKRVAQAWLEAGDQVAVTTRSEKKAAELKSLGYQPIVTDLRSVEQHTFRQQAFAALGPIETVLYAVGYDRKNPQGTIQEVFAGGLKNILDALPHTVRRVIYISSTGVYGDHAGAWVEESAPTNPQREGGHAALAAEQVLLTHPLFSFQQTSTLPLSERVILRLAGIYGPDRLPYLDKILAGKPLAVPQQGYLNLVHVTDAVGVILEIEEQAGGNTEMPAKTATETAVTKTPVVEPTKSATELDLKTSTKTAVTKTPVVEPTKSAAKLDLETPTKTAAKTAIYSLSDGRPVKRADFYTEITRQLGVKAPVFTQPAAGSPRALRATTDRRISNRRLVARLGYSFVYPSYRSGLSSILKGEDLSEDKAKKPNGQS